MTWVGVFGTRNYSTLSDVTGLVFGLDLDDVVVSGGGGAVDERAEHAARNRGLATCIFPAQWKRHGGSAGPIRNSKAVEVLVQHQGRAVFFWDGVSKGTADTLRKAIAAGLPVEVIGPPAAQAANERLAAKFRPAPTLQLSLPATSEAKPPEGGGTW